jgi:MYXO-CTERM domain-containing protein
MKLLALLAAFVLLALAPLATAGSPESPEIQDKAHDADAGDALDIAAVWVDGGDPLNVTFHILVPKLPALEAATGKCADPGCAALTLSFKLEFAVLAPDGIPAPALEHYNRTYAVYRHGAPAGLQAAVGYLDDEGGLTITGPASAGVAAGGEVVLKVARNSTAVNLPAGATPGAYRLNRTLAYSAPELCAPPPTAAACIALSKPAQTTGTPPVEASTEWDTAPDAGFGSDYVFAAPPPVTSQELGSPAPTTTGTDSPSPTPPPEQAPAATPPSGTTAHAPAASTGTGSPSTAPKGSSSSTTSKASPGPEALLLLAGLAAAVAVRRRL